MPCLLSWNKTDIDIRLCPRSGVSHGDRVSLSIRYTLRCQLTVRSGWWLTEYSPPVHGPLCANMMSSIQPEVHDVWQRRQLGPRAMATCRQHAQITICWRLAVKFRRYTRAHIHAQRNTLLSYPGQSYPCMFSTSFVVHILVLRKWRHAYAWSKPMRHVLERSPHIRPKSEVRFQ